MKCWNCHQETPDEAKVCRYCEADLTEHEPMTPEIEEATKAFLGMLPESVGQGLMELLEQSDTAEDFANAILLGDCPACESSKVRNLDDDPEYQDITLGQCLDCGTVWCSDCEYVLKENERACPNDGQHIWDNVDIEDEDWENDEEEEDEEEEDEEDYEDEEDDEDDEDEEEEEKDPR